MAHIGVRVGPALWLAILSFLILYGSSFPLDNFVGYLSKRQSPTGTYAPGEVTIKGRPNLIRSGPAISSNESRWLAARDNVTRRNMAGFLSRSNLTGISIASVANSTSAPRAALAFSGGGFRSLLNGAGAMQAFDNRTASGNSSAAGLFQAASYSAGLSGGSWLVGSLAINNVSTIPNQLKMWNLDDNVLGSDFNIFSRVNYYRRIVNQVDDKRDAGFDVSITDYWGRALAQKFINGSNGVPYATFSDIRNQSWFTSHDAPFPIVVAAGREPNQKLKANETTIWEFNPYEFGTVDRDINAFANMTNIGSYVKDGTNSSNTYVEGFDNFGFVLGTSSSVFNELVRRLNSSDSNILTRVIDNLASEILENNDLATYPNVFRDYNPNKNSSVADQDTLYLVDGGESNQNIPFWPLLNPERGLDVIFAVDSSADFQNYPNGSSLYTTYQSAQKYVNDTSAIVGFPNIPEPSTFISQKLNTKPTFFGCNSTNTTTENADVPLVVYLPNSDYSYNSNFSTSKLTYSEKEQNGMLQNAFNSVTYNNNTEFGTCIACAIIERQLERSNSSRPTQCQRCFQQYCYN